jgi:hypothetical protein
MKVKDETRNERRKETQEVFTPSAIVEYMLDKIPFEEFGRLDKTWLDNSCGNGNILEGIIRRRFKAVGDLTDDKILAVLSTTFGTELMEDNVLECRQRLFGLAVEYGYQGIPDKLYNIIRHNIVCTDMFDWNYREWAPIIRPVERKLL